MATAQQYLDSLGLNITVQMAKDFIIANLDNLEVIYQAASIYGITNDMLAEILNIDGVDGQFVSDYFTSNGFDPNRLGFNEEELSNTISIESGFTEEWLNNKTLYGAFDWGEDGWTYSKTTFSNGVITYENTIDGDFSETYTLLNNGTIQVNTSNGGFVWEIDEITQSYIDVTPHSKEQDLFFFNSDDAQSYVNTKNSLSNGFTKQLLNSPSGIDMEFIVREESKALHHASVLTGEIEFIC